MKRFSGIWENENGDRLIIIQTSLNTAVCDIISGLSGRPIIREYLDNKPTVKLKVELDYYESGIEIDLGKKLKMCLDDLEYQPKAQTLSGGISRPFGSEYDYLDKYISVFSLKPFRRIE